MQVTPSLEKTPCVQYSFLPRPVGLKSCLWVLYVIYFRERNPAGGAVFKQRLVNGLSLSRPKACWVRELFVGMGHSRLGYWERTAASASWLATFSLAGGLPWRLARSWLLSDLNPLQAACDGPATATFLTLLSSPLTVAVKCVYLWRSSVQKGSIQHACLTQGWTFCFMGATWAKHPGIQPAFPRGFCSPRCI